MNRGHVSRMPTRTAGPTAVAGDHNPYVRGRMLHVKVVCYGRAAALPDDSRRDRCRFLGCSLGHGLPAFSRREMFEPRPVCSLRDGTTATALGADLIGLDSDEIATDPLELQQSCFERNQALLKSLRQDPQSEELLRKIYDDAKVGS